jgi:hypothetical protein
MMKRALSIFVFFLISGSAAFAQNKNDSLNFPIVMKFESVCCGVPDDKPFKKYLTQFKKKNKITSIHASYIGPMGREGEYYIGFPLTEMKSGQKSAFMKGLKSVASKMRDKGQAVTERNFHINTSTLSERTVIKEVEF